MDAPADIAAFRQAIGHDADAGRMLLRLFIETVDAAVGKLHISMPAAFWQAELHLIKGAALNVRASRLAEAAAQAHALGESSPEEKGKALERVLTAYAELRDYLIPLTV